MEGDLHRSSGLDRHRTSCNKTILSILVKCGEMGNDQPNEEWYADADHEIMILERKPTVGLVNVMISEHRLLLYSIRT